MAKKTSEPIDMFATIETKKTGSKKQDKPRHKMSKDLDSTISKYIKLKEEIDNKTAELAIIDAKLKEAGCDKYVSVYEETGKNCGTFLMESHIGDVVMFTPKDQYKKLEQEDHEYLNKKYDNKISEATEVISFNGDMFKKHRAAISKALMGSKDIPDEDKAKLFTKTPSWNIKKGTIEIMEELRQLVSKKEKREVKMQEVFVDARIICAMSPKEA